MPEFTFPDMLRVDSVPFRWTDIKPIIFTECQGCLKTKNTREQEFNGTIYNLCKKCRKQLRKGWLILPHSQFQLMKVKGIIL